MTIIIPLWLFNILEILGYIIIGIIIGAIGWFIIKAILSPITPEDGGGW